MGNGFFAGFFVIYRTVNTTISVHNTVINNISNFFLFIITPFYLFLICFFPLIVRLLTVVILSIGTNNGTTP